MIYILLYRTIWNY